MEEAPVVLLFEDPTEVLQGALEKSCFLFFDPILHSGIIMLGVLAENG